MRRPQRAVAAVHGASLRPRRVGAADIDDGRVLQSGWSAVETVRPLSGRARLNGRFAPPTEPTRGQRFSIVIDDGTAAGHTAFEWHTGREWGPGEEIDFEAPVESESVRGIPSMELVRESGLG